MGGCNWKGRWIRMMGHDEWVRKDGWGMIDGMMGGWGKMSG